MPTFFHPENALKRANEFYELGKDEEALECLCDALKNRKSRMMKHSHEMIIYKLLELSVKHKKSQMAKDGLYSYRNLCQGINSNSWEDSVSYYIKLSESKVETAEETYHSIIDEIDHDMTPELLLKYVSSESSQDRTERIILLPWIKFLSECYRNCLDLLKNAQSSRLYHTVAKSAFRFCVKFSRKSELRKLCNVIKIHAIYMQNKQTWSKNYDAEIHFMCLDTGFVELDSAIKMELWQDAFKAIENINALMNVSKHPQHSKIVAHYYHKISLIFWKGGEYLFHAAANFRYFSILKEQKKNLNAADIVKLVSRLVLSILAIPPLPVNPATDLIIETDVTVIDRKNKSLSSLLFLTKCPTKASLIKDVVQLNIVQYLPKEFADLFQILENNSDVVFPSISTYIDFIKNWSNGELEEYIPLIQKNFLAKLLPSLSNLYANIKMTKFLDLTGIAKISDLEIILADSARRCEFPLRIDHRNMCVHFPNDFNVFRNEKVWDESLSEDLRPNTHLRWLIDVHSALKSAVMQVQPKSKESKHKIISAIIANHYFNEKESCRKSLLKRRNVIEKYKESLEKSKIKKEEEERKRITEKLLQYETAEKERLQRETEERKLQRLRREQEEIKRKLFLEKMEAFRKTVFGSQIVENLELENIDNLDPQILFSKQVEQLNKERKQLNLRLKRQERNLDHFERAKRIEEIPLITEEYEKEKGIDEKLWNEAVKNKIDTACKKREEELKKKNRVIEIKPDLKIFLDSVKKRHFENYKEEMIQFKKTFEEEKQKRMEKKAEEGKEKKREDWIKQQSIKENKETELKNQGIWMNKIDCMKNTPRKIVKNQNFKHTPSTKKPENTPTVDKIIFSEDVSSGKEKISYSELKRGKYDTPETSEGIHISNSVYYCKRTYNSDAVEAEKMYQKRASIFIETSSDLFTKSSYNRPNMYSVGEQRMRNSTYESSSSSNESLLSWRTPWALKDSYTHQSNRSNKEREMPPQNITILRRETRPETTKDKKDSYAEKEKIPKPESTRSDIIHSCTPWAKLKQQTHEK